jgi:uncharacterized lipoprotein YddW (UPF0748 family)
VVLLLVLFINSIVVSQELTPKREFRGTWIATVGNIDWPSSRNASAFEQINELRRQLKKLKKAGINAVMFQVRAECDAFYNSSIEPWSYWLTGKQGKAPEPFYDPLEIAIREAHALGMELHAWFNPYRAVRNKNAYKPSPDHISRKHPEWILTFGRYMMLDPGNPAVKNYITSVIAEVVKNYDVDGVHFDDYFYPFSPKITRQDAGTFKKYHNGYKNIDEWRRYNITSMISQVYDSIKAIKPYVKFGVSPFGIVQNHYAGTNGFDSYSNIYSDPLKWINNKNIDYIAPQLYWEIGKPSADYKSLLKWWSTVAGERHLYIGLYSSKFMSEEWSDKGEIGRQVRLNRNTANVPGSVFFSSRTITENISGFADTLAGRLFKYPALLPVMPWVDSIPPLAPYNLTADSAGPGHVILLWDEPAAAADGDSAACYVVYKFSNSETPGTNRASSIVFITKSNYAIFEKAEINHTTVIVTALDRMQNESDSTAKIVISEFPE